MSTEEFIRKKHELEDALYAFYLQVDQFLAATDLLSTRELEICIARAIDRSIKAPDEFSHSAKFRIFLLNSALSRRSPGFRPSTFTRFLKSVVPDQLIAQLIDWNFGFPVAIEESQFPGAINKTLQLPDSKDVPLRPL